MREGSVLFLEGWLCLRELSAGSVGEHERVLVAVAGLAKERRAQKGPREHGVKLRGGIWEPCAKQSMDKESEELTLGLTGGVGGQRGVQGIPREYCAGRACGWRRSFVLNCVLFPETVVVMTQLGMVCGGVWACGDVVRWYLQPGVLCCETRTWD